MTKKHYRFDHTRNLWRSVAWDGRFGFYFLMKCIDCGEMGEAASKKFPRCNACRRARYETFRKAGQRAHNAVNRAIQQGKLPVLDGSIQCTDCNAPAKVYDHREYAKPLDVHPVCRVCNHLRGSAIDVPLKREKIFKVRRAHLHLVRA